MTDDMLLVVICDECRGVLMAVAPKAKVLNDMLGEISDALDEGHALEDYSKTMLGHAPLCSCEGNTDD